MVKLVKSNLVGVMNRYKGVEKEMKTVGLILFRIGEVTGLLKAKNIIHLKFTLA